MTAHNIITAESQADDADIYTAISRCAFVRKFPHEAADDENLDMAALALLAYRASHTDLFVPDRRLVNYYLRMNHKVVKRSLATIKACDYLDRWQETEDDGRFARAKEDLRLRRKGSGFQLLNFELGELPWRQLAIVVYLRRHARNFHVTPAQLAERFGVTVRTIKNITKPMIADGILETQRLGTGRTYGYQVIDEALPRRHDMPVGDRNPSPHRRGVSQTPPPDSRLVSGKIGTTAKRKNGACGEMEKLGPHNKDEQSNNHSAFGFVDEQNNKRFTSNEVCRRSFDDLKGNPDLDFGSHDMAEANMLETLFDGAPPEAVEPITDEQIIQMARQATQGRIGGALLTDEGLQSARTLLAAMLIEEPDYAHADCLNATLQAFGRLLWKQVGSKPGKWLNSWMLVAKRLAAMMYQDGLDELYPCEREEIDDDVIADVLKRASESDACWLLSPKLFSAKGADQLRKMLEPYGTEGIEPLFDCLMQMGMFSDRHVPGAIKSWRYFEGAIADGVHTAQVRQEGIRPGDVYCMTDLPF